MLLLTLLPFVSSAIAQKHWFSFGDSYTATGFSISGQLPSTGNPLGNPTYPGSTATGGENWVDYQTTTYNTSEVFTYNFAYSGAVIDESLVTPFDPSVQSLTEQVSQFLDNQAVIPGWTSDESFFSVWIGINDIGNTYSQSGDRDAFTDRLLDAHFALVEKLRSLRISTTSTAGARNFLFANVPPVDRSPLMVYQNNRDVEATVINGYNAKLVQRATSLETKYADVQTWIWDTHATFTTILDSPTSYGFRDSTSYGSGSDIFWGDVYHPSSYVHKYLAEDASDVLSGFI